MNTRFAAVGAAALAALALSAPAGAVDYVDVVAMDERPTPQIRSCRNVDTIRLPLRSSGADLVPVYANDYAEITPSGSIFDKNGLSVELALDNGLPSQLAAYMACETPVMRATQGMLNLAAPVTETDPRTEQVAIFQHGWSNGADALVARANVSQPGDLSGGTIVMQAYGPHVGYAARILADAEKAVVESGGDWQQPTILYTEELVGLYGETPAAAFLDNPEIDAAFVTIFDANVLTSGGKVGTGAEGSVKGAEILMSTKSASRVISEVYVVRRDFFEADRARAHALVKALFSAEEKVREDVVKQIVDWDLAAGFLLDDQSAEEDAKTLWRTVETTGLAGNRQWAGDSHPRAWHKINNEIQSDLYARGLIAKTRTLAVADWDYDSFAGGLFDQRRVELPGFDQNKTAETVQKLQDQGSLDDNTLISFEINFKPNQMAFPLKDYREDFNEAIELVSTYAGAVMTVEGHSSPHNYLVHKHPERYGLNRPAASVSKLRQIRRAADNLSYRRADAVREALIDAAQRQGLNLDESQFVVVGKGISDPKTGMCGQDPCGPKSQAEFFSDMRVSFRMVQVEAESEAFTPPINWQ